MDTEGTGASAADAKRSEPTFRRDAEMNPRDAGAPRDWKGRTPNVARVGARSCRITRDEGLKRGANGLTLTALTHGLEIV